MANEQYGFVFAVIFMIVFASLTAAMPAGLQGPDEDPLTIIPVDPSIVSGFAESEGFNGSDFSIVGALSIYEYTLGGRDWFYSTDDATVMILIAKVYFLVFWFGQVDVCTFKAPDGTERGEELTFSEIQADQENGVVRYSMTFTTSGESAGSFILYYNVTEYATFIEAWNNDEVYLLHGMGIAETSGANIGALLINLLFLRLPDVPPLVNVLLATPVWASIIFVLWFIIKEMIPFL
jgi:predicted secreted protein